MIVIKQSEITEQTIFFMGIPELNNNFKIKNKKENRSLYFLTETNKGVSSRKHRYSKDSKSFY